MDGMVHCVLSRFPFGGYMTDDRDWQEEYKKLKVNFDRLDRMNDVLYRYWYVLNKHGGIYTNEIRDARLAVEKYFEELENEYQRRRNPEASEQEG